MVLVTRGFRKRSVHVVRIPAGRPPHPDCRLLLQISERIVEDWVLGSSPRIIRRHHLGSRRPHVLIISRVLPHFGPLRAISALMCLLEITPHPSSIAKLRLKDGTRGGRAQLLLRTSPVAAHGPLQRVR